MSRSNITGGDEEDSTPMPPGHSTADLGPSDTSDSGSDIAGPGIIEESILDDAGTTSDLERAYGAGLDIGDADLDSDSDAGGTGERGSAGRDSSAREAADIAPDQITEDPGGLVEGEDPEGIGVTRKK